MTLLTISALAPSLLKTDVNEATESQTVACFTALYLVAVASGGVKACISAYGADQFDDNDKAEKKLKSSIFNWYYQMMNIDSLIAHSLIVWVQDNVGWDWGFGIPSMAMVMGVVSFFSGTWFYRNHKPGGSPLTSLFQVVVASLRKKRINVQTDASLLYETADANSSTTGSRQLNHTRNLSCIHLKVYFTRARSEKSLIRWATPQLHDIDSLAKMVDPTLNDMYPAKSLSRFADIIALCVQPEPEFWPPMSEVVLVLVRSCKGQVWSRDDPVTTHDLYTKLQITRRTRCHISFLNNSFGTNSIAVFRTYLCKVKDSTLMMMNSMKRFENVISISDLENVYLIHFTSKAGHLMFKLW